jgi:Phage tail assembly chaperone proteins, E, or 41 or 14
MAVQQFHDIAGTASGATGAPMVPPSTPRSARGQQASLPAAGFAHSALSTTTIELVYAVEWHGADLEELQLRRPIGRDMRFLPQGDDAGIEDMFPFFALLAGVDEELMDELDAEDIMGISEYVKECSAGNSTFKMPNEMPPSFPVPLQYPITYDGKPVAKLSLRRPKGKDMRKMPKGDNSAMSDMYPFYAHLADVEVAMIDELDVADIARLSVVTNRFLSKPKQKGKSSPRRRTK